MRKGAWWTVAAAGAVTAAAAGIAVWVVSRTQSPSGIHTTGTVEGVEVNVAAMVPGTIVKEKCREGDTVEQGEVIIELESAELRSELQQAKASLHKAQADVDVQSALIDTATANAEAAEADIENAEAEIQRATADMEEKRTERDRTQALFDQGIASKSELDVAVTAFNSALATLRAAQATAASAKSRKNAATAQLTSARNQLKAAQAQAEVARANVAVAQAKLDYTVIHSPIDGTVVYKALEQGETANPGVTILTLVDMRSLYVRVDIDQTNVTQIALGHPAEIRVEGYPGRVFHGAVAEIGSYAEFATQRDVTRGRQDIKTFKVRIDLADAGGLLKPGMTVVVDIPPETAA